MIATNGLRERLAGRHSDDALRDAVQRIRLGIHTANLPPKIRSFLSDMGRRDGRNQHPFGRFPEIAREVAREGAPLSSVLAPLTMLEAELSGLYADKLPGISECQHGETNANRDFDHAQLAVAEGELTVAEIDEATETGNTQIANTKIILARLASLRSKIVGR